MPNRGYWKRFKSGATRRRWPVVTVAVLGLFLFVGALRDNVLSRAVDALVDAIAATEYWRILAHQASQHPFLTFMAACGATSVVVLLLAWRDAKGAAWTAMRSPERPWVRIHEEPKLQANGDVTFVFKNFGQTPAYAVTGEAWFEISAVPVPGPQMKRLHWWQLWRPKNPSLFPGGCDFKVEADSRNVPGVSKMKMASYILEPDHLSYVYAPNRVEQIIKILRMEQRRLVRVRVTLTYTDNTEDLDGETSYCYGHSLETAKDGKGVYKIFKWFSDETNVSK